MNSNLVKLNELQVGENATVESVDVQSRVRRRLMDMGIVKGTKISVSGKAPMGDPIELRVRGYNLTLRKNEAKDVMVERA